MLCPSFTIWFLLTIEFLASTFLFILVAILKVFKSLLPEPPRDLTETVVLVRVQASPRDSLENFARFEDLEIVKFHKLKEVARFKRP